jgi:hypothetical protein
MWRTIITIILSIIIAVTMPVSNLNIIIRLVTVGVLLVSMLMVVVALLIIMVITTYYVEPDHVMPNMLIIEVSTWTSRHAQIMVTLLAHNRKVGDPPLTTLMNQADGP